MHVSSTGFTCRRVFVIAEPILQAQTSPTRIDISGNNNFRKHKRPCPRFYSQSFIPRVRSNS